MNTGAGLIERRLTLHPLGAIHAAFVRSLYAETEVTRMLLRIQRPLSAQEALALCDSSLAKPGEHRFAAVLESSGRPVGVGIVRAADAAATIGYSVAPSFWRQGIGTEVASLLVQFAERIGSLEVRATTLDTNTASERILTRLGFVVVDPDARETDSRGDERRVVRWTLHAASGGGRPG